jgi:hypothetical protein
MACRNLQIKVLNIDFPADELIQSFNEKKSRPEKNLAQLKLI